MWRSNGKSHQDATSIGSVLGLMGLAGQEMRGSGSPARRPTMRVRPDAVRPEAANEKDIN
jgi:hypothetical protein